jgi:hypothetical protein
MRRRWRSAAAARPAGARAVLRFHGEARPERDVRLQTDRIVRLTHILRHLDNPRPPICKLDWGGKTANFPFVGIVGLEQQFLLFHATGQPLRATLKVVFLNSWC